MTRVAAPVVGWSLCCACSGAAPSPTNGAVAAPAPPAEIAPLPSGRQALPLQYSAPEGCPGVEGYLSDVRARSSQLTLEPASASTEGGGAAAVASAGAGTTVDVRIEAALEAPGWLGQVAITGPSALEREVRGERCEDVVSALALITVLRLEGGAREPSAGAAGVASPDGTSGAAGAGAAITEGAPGAAASPSSAAASSEARSSPAAASQPAAPSEPEAAAQPAPAASASPPPSAPSPSEPSARAEAPAAAPSAAAGAPSSEPDSATLEAVPPRSSDEGRASARVSRASEPERPEAIGGEPTQDEPSPPSDSSATATSASEGSGGWRWPATRGAAAALAGYATVPSQAFRAALEGELWLGEGDSAWLSSLSLAYARGQDAVAPGDLGLTLLTLELALCPPSFVAASSVWISACASARAGGVHLALTSTDPAVFARDTWRPWVSLGPSLRAGVPLSERWALRGVAQLMVQLMRDTFAITVSDPDDPTIATSLPLYRPEVVSFELGAGIGYSF